MNMRVTDYISFKAIFTLFVTDTGEPSVLNKVFTRSRMIWFHAVNGCHLHQLWINSGKLAYLATGQ